MEIHSPTVPCGENPLHQKTGYFYPDKDYGGFLEQADNVVFRIEALRAASRIVVGPNFQTTIPLVAATFEIAEQFARWLEAGER